MVVVVVVPRDDKQHTPPPNTHPHAAELPRHYVVIVVVHCRLPNLVGREPVPPRDDREVAAAPAREVDRRDVEHAVIVDREGDLDLRPRPPTCLDLDLEPAEEVVVARLRALALEDLRR